MDTWKIVIALGLFLSSGATRAQTGTKDVFPNPYRNFTGCWVGSTQMLRNGVIKTEPVSISIAEITAKHLMRFDYVYSGTSHSKATRFVSLEPSKEKLEEHFEGDPKAEFQAEGLDQFALAGIGSFTAVAPAYPGSRVKLTRVTIHLSSDALTYEWELTSDGLNYKTVSLNSFRRGTC